MSEEQTDPLCGMFGDPPSPPPPDLVYKRTFIFLEVNPVISGIEHFVSFLSQKCNKFFFFPPLHHTQQLRSARRSANKQIGVGGGGAASAVMLSNVYNVIQQRDVIRLGG